jgi:hypothetical protein
LERSDDLTGTALRPVAGNSGHARLLRAAFIALLVFAPIPWVVAHFMPPHNHDASALLQFAQRWLGGERLYVDLIDVNPPLIFLLSAVPALLAQYTPLSSTAALVVCTFAWILVASLMAWRLLIQDDRIVHSPMRWLLPPLFMYLAIVHPGIEFTQREHLMMVATLPYVLLAAARLQGDAVPRWLVLSVAALAAVGFAIKPHFLIVPALVELYVLAVRGPRAALRDPVPWTLGAVFVAYAIWVLVALPQYLTDVVPLVTAQYVDLGIGSSGRLGVLLQSDLTPTFLLAVPLVLLAFISSRLPLARILALVAGGAIVFAVVQGKGWDYQLVPPEAFVIALGAVLACEWLERATRALEAAEAQRLALGLLVGFMFGAYYLTGHDRPLFPRKIHWEAGTSGRLLAHVGREASGGAVLALTPGLFPHYPIFNYTGAFQALRFMNLWVLQSAYGRCRPDGVRYRDIADMPTSERLVFEAVAQDMARYRPRLVIVDKIPGIPWCGSEFDFLEYFLRNPAFAEMWSDYREIDAFDRYRIFARP